MANYLDITGLIYFQGKIKAYVSGLSYYTKPSTGIPSSDITSGVILDVSGKEDKSNKATSISFSFTDMQYPSTKTMYNLVGDIETLLTAI